MTPAQLATFKASILADPNLTAARNTNSHGIITDYYNVSGAVYVGGAPVTIPFVWRPSIPAAEVNSIIVWSEFAVLSVQLQNTYTTMIQNGFNATSQTMRNGFTTVFGAVSVSRDNLIALSQTPPTRFEALFATTNVSAVFGQRVTNVDVAAALGS